MSDPGDVHTVDEDGNTPLLRAVRDKEVCLAQYWIMLGANLFHQNNNGQSVTHLSHGHYAMRDVITTAHEASMKGQGPPRYWLNPP